MAAEKGTIIYCPVCKIFQDCRSVHSIGEITGAVGRDSEDDCERWTTGKANYFRRIRHCSVCNAEFPTAEIDESVIIKLLEIDEILSDIYTLTYSSNNNLLDSTKRLYELMDKIEGLLRIDPLE